MKYIKDFSSLEQYLKENEIFINNGGMVLLEKGRMRCFAYLLYSIFLYLDYEETADMDSMKEYIWEIIEYAHKGKTYELHSVNCARLYIMDNYFEPMNYCEKANVHDRIFIDKVFYGFLSISRNWKILNPILKYFKENTYNNENA